MVSSWRENMYRVLACILRFWYIMRFSSSSIICSVSANDVLALFRRHPYDEI